MTLNDFVKKYSGKFIEFHSYSNNSLYQCVDCVNQWLVEGLGLEAIIGTNAIDFPSKAVARGMLWIPNTPDGIPQPGDLIVYEGEIGHIDIAYYGCTSTKVVAFSQNYPTGSPCVIRSSSYLRPKVIGWLHSEETMTSDEIAVKKTDFENLVKKSTMFDEILAKYNVPDAQGLYNMVAGKDARITDLGNQLGTYQAETKNKEELLSRCQQEVLNLQDEINGLQSRLDQSNNTVTQLGKDKGSLAIQVAQLTTQLETARRGTYTITVAEFFKLLWNQKLSISKG